MHIYDLIRIHKSGGKDAIERARRMGQTTRHCKRDKKTEARDG